VPAPLAFASVTLLFYTTISAADTAICSRTATANTTFSYYAEDGAGNTSSVQTLAINNIDTTPPTVSLGIPAKWTWPPPSP